MTNKAQATTEIAVSMQDETTVSIQKIDLTKPLPNLSDFDTYPVDLMAEYWTPLAMGESKRVIFLKISTSLVKSSDPNIPDLIELECAYFLAQDENGAVKQFRNGSKRLVGALQESLISGFLSEGTPLLITYVGKKKNATNSFQSDNWSIKPLMIKVPVLENANGIK